MAHPISTLSQPNYGNMLGGAQGAAYLSPFQSAQPPTWEQVFHLQRIIMDLQQEVVRLQSRLDKVTNVKEWFVGPDTPSVDPGK